MGYYQQFISNKRVCYDIVSALIMNNKYCMHTLGPKTGLNRSEVLNCAISERNKIIILAELLLVTLSHSSTNRDRHEASLCQRGNTTQVKDTHFTICYNIVWSHLTIVAIAGAYRVLGFGERVCCREPAQLSGAHFGELSDKTCKVPTRTYSTAAGSGSAATACLYPLPRRRRQLTVPRPAHLVYLIVYIQCLHERSRVTLT